MNTSENNKTNEILSEKTENRDKEGRSIDYLRISVTDRCNLRCCYCMPEGIKLLEMSDILSYEEIEHIVRVFAEEGISRLKVTGGEPLVRPGCPGLIKRLKSVPGIEEISITTNGILLKKNLDELKEAGLDGINISLDTLNREKYRKITGFDKLKEVLEAVDAAVDSGIRTKINTAVMKGINTDEILELARMAMDRALDVRFIEMMPIGYGSRFEYADNSYILAELKKEYPDMTGDSRRHGNGPAVYYSIPGFAGGIGFISAVSNKFCENCNRMRLTSTGVLKYCLCFEDGSELKSILRDNGMSESLKDERLREEFRRAMAKKPKEHCFEDRSRISETKEMFRIGG